MIHRRFCSAPATATLALALALALANGLAKGVAFSDSRNAFSLRKPGGFEGWLQHFLVLLLV